MTNIVMIICDRYRLTEQTLQSLTAHTKAQDYNLTIVDNGSTDFRMLKLYEKYKAANVTLIGIERPTGYVGKARNLGAYWSEQVFGRGEYICFLDNDLCLGVDWLTQLTKPLEYLEVPAILGGHQHPYHKTKRSVDELNEVDAVAGYSMIMWWGTWADYGPFRSNTIGPGQSEDFEICSRIWANGGLCAYVHPPVLEHCGITNSKGEPAVGAELFPRVSGVLYE